MPAPDPTDLVENGYMEDLLRRIPTQLYRYSGLLGNRLQWMKELIVDSQLYFASPSSFNDPFDCRVPLIFDASTLRIQQHWRRVAKRIYPNSKMVQHKLHIQKLILDSKTPKGQERLTNLFFKSLDGHGTACFAKDPTSMLLWSYYAEGHTGVALRFNMSLVNLGKIAGSPGHLIPVEVKYQTAFPLVNYYNQGSIDDFVMTILGTKSAAWKHEEWRLVLVERCGHVRIPASMIDGIILGMRINPKTEATVRGWVEQRSPTPEMLRVVNRPGTFELELVPA